MLRSCEIEKNNVMLAVADCQYVSKWAERSSLLEEERRQVEDGYSVGSRCDP